MSKKKFPIYRFVKCDGYLKKNQDKWHLFFYDKFGSVCDKLQDADKVIANKDYFYEIGEPDEYGFRNYVCGYKTSQELEFGEYVHQDIYNYKEEPFEGFLVEVRNLMISKDIGPDWNDGFDTGIGYMPERYYIARYNEKIVKVGKVYIKRNGQYKLVPVENIHDLEVI